MDREYINNLFEKYIQKLPDHPCMGCEAGIRRGQRFLLWPMQPDEVL